MEIYPEVKSIHMPQTFNEKTVLLRKVALLRKLSRSFWCSATVLEDIIDQRLFVVDVKFGGYDVVEKRSEVSIILGWIDLGYCRSQDH